MSHHIHNQQTDWLRCLDFYFQELEILKARLPDINPEHDRTIANDELTHFRDQFYVQQQNIIRLQSGITDNLASIRKDIKDAGELKPGEDDTYDYRNLAGKFEAEEQAISALRSSFNQYCALYL